MIVLVPLAGSVACELGEINVPSTEPIVVVQSVMRPDRLYQWILVEQTLTGRLAGQRSVDIVPSNEPLQAAIVNARVFVANMNLPNDPCGPTTEFVQTAPPGEPDQGGVYWSPAGCPTMRAGDTLELRVEALDSIVTGKTEIPGFRAATLRAGTTSTSTPFAQLAFNRDTDTLDASVDATHGRAIHIELHRPVIDGVDSVQAIKDDGSWFWVDSTRLTLPGDFLNFFEGEFESDGGSAPDLFVAGFEYEVTTSFMDKNLFDAFRSANFPLSGRGFISNLSGGYGLFGSLVAQANTLRVTGEVDDPREGLYEISGVVDGRSINLEIELYVGRQWRSDYFPTLPVAAFADGVWVDGQYHRSITGSMDPDGRAVIVVPQQIVEDPFDGRAGHVLQGTWPDGTTGSLDVFLGDRITPAGTVTIRRL